MDFVTNSSSAVYILARRPGFTEKQKEAILRFVEEEFLGEKLPLEPGSTREEIEEVLFDEYDLDLEDESVDKIADAVAGGYTITLGDVSFEEGAGENQARIHDRLWKLLEENGDGNFRGIETDLDY